MKLSTTLILVLVSLGLASSREMYSNKYDNINVDAILRSDRLLKQYMACILDVGPCSPEGRYFRSILPEAIATTCDKCTPKMKINVRKVSNHLRQHRPNDWAKFVQKYNHDNKYTKAIERFLNE